MNERHPGIVIFVTFVAAFILTLLPMPGWTVWLRPNWVLMVLVYWATILPYRVNIGIAWIIGIFLDVLNGSLLGEHALALAIVTYLIVRIDTQFRMFPILQQGLGILILVLLYQFILFCIQGFLGDLPGSFLYWLSPLTSMILWPWVYIIMRDCRRRFKIA